MNPNGVAKFDITLPSTNQTDGLYIFVSVTAVYPYKQHFRNFILLCCNQVQFLDYYDNVGYYKKPTPPTSDGSNSISAKLLTKKYA